jgi:hypothetical protein
MRIHSTSKQKLVLHDASTRRSFKPEYKPEGLWYSMDWEWLRWVRSEMPKWEHPNHFDIEVDLTKMLVLSSVPEIRKFTAEFGMPAPYVNSLKFIGGDMKFLYIDWPKVAEQYSGIEIPEYQWPLRHKLMWYYGWDVASGCIWRPDAVIKVRKVEVPDEAL